MKILYTLGNFFHSGHQVLLYTINACNEAVENYQIEVEKCFAESMFPKDDMFKTFNNIVPIRSPTINDMIWINTSGNQFIGCGIWQEKPTSPINFDALRLIIASARKKAENLGQRVLSMPLITRNHDLALWNFIYPIIEKEFCNVDIQVIVYIPSEKDLLKVSDSIGEKFNILEIENPKIGFTQNNKN